MELSEYSYLWDGSEEGWCLLKSDDSDRMLIFNQSTSAALIVEIEDLKQKLCELMLANGAPIITEIEERECVVEIIEDD